MPSWVDIANQALIKLGDYNFITSLEDSKKSAIMINTSKGQARDYCLRLCHWNFAKKRDQLAADTTDSPFGSPTRRFQKPADFIRVISINDDENAAYELEGEYILYDGEPCNLLYVARIDDPNKFDPLFCELLSTHLARTILPGMKDSASDKAALKKDFEGFLQQARAVNGQERGARYSYSEGFIESRY